MNTEPASFVFINKITREGVYETYNKKLIAKLNTEKYEAVPVLQYLQELNRNIKNNI